MDGLGEAFGEAFARLRGGFGKCFGRFLEVVWEVVGRFGVFARNKFQNPMFNCEKL